MAAAHPPRRARIAGRAAPAALADAPAQARRQHVPRASPVTTSRVAARPGSSSPGSSSPELLRALGSAATSTPACCHPHAERLGLPAPTAAEHTGVFVLAAPPHAAIHLGEQGKLGGEGLDRGAGFWGGMGL